jgi:hypothetical protein
VVDFNDDGDWSDSGEQIFTNQPLSAGGNNLNFAVPAEATVTPQTFARFRLSTESGLSFTGQALDGEVEDYQVAINSLAGFTVTETAGGTEVAENGTFDQETDTFTVVLDVQPALPTHGSNRPPFLAVTTVFGCEHTIWLAAASGPGRVISP